MLVFPLRPLELPCTILVSYEGNFIHSNGHEPTSMAVCLNPDKKTTLSLGNNRLKVMPRVTPRLTWPRPRPSCEYMRTSSLDLSKVEVKGIDPTFSKLEIPLERLQDSSIGTIGCRKSLSKFLKWGFRSIIFCSFGADNYNPLVDALIQLYQRLSHIAREP